MKKLIVATTITSFAAGAALAGSLDDAMMEDKVMEVEEVAVAEPAGSAGSIVPVVLGLLLVGLAVSASSDSPAN